MLMPYGTAHSYTCSLSTGSGRSRWASSAISGNPAVRKVSTTCCLVSCIATTELSLLCEIAVFILSSSPVRASACLVSKELASACRLPAGTTPWRQLAGYRFEPVRVRGLRGVMAKQGCDGGAQRLELLFPGRVGAPCHVPIGANQHGATVADSADP